MSLFSVNGKLLTTASGLAIAASVSAVTPPASASTIQLSYYQLFQAPYTDLTQNMNAVFGTPRGAGGAAMDERQIELWREGYLADDGAVTGGFPNAETYASAAMLSQGYAANPDFYNGRVLVFEAREGRFVGPGNDIDQGGGLGATTLLVDLELEQDFTANGTQTDFVFTGAAGWAADQIYVYLDGHSHAERQKPGTAYTVADNGGDLTVSFATAPANGANVFCSLVRKEVRIDDSSTAGTYPNGGISVGTPANIQGFKLGIFFKDEEADYRARFDEPRKAWAPWLRAKLANSNSIRPMNLGFPMANEACVADDLARMTDQTLNARPAGTHPDNNWDLNGSAMRQANPNLALLDFCANHDGIVRTPWLTIPGWFGLPVFPTINPELLQKGTPTARISMNPRVMDLTQPITITAESVAGVATVNVAEKHFYIDGTDKFSHTGETPYSFTFTFTDVRGNPQTYTHVLRILHWSPNGPNDYLIWQQADQWWSSNQSYFENHWACASFADLFLDWLESVNWPAAHKVLVEVGNEIWNIARPFYVATSHADGVGSVYGSFGSYGGHGYLIAMLKKAIDDRQAARGLNYDFRMVIASWTASPGTTDAKLKAYKYYWETVEGLSGSALAAKMAETEVKITNYWGGAFVDDAARNFTGLSGQAHTDQVLSYFPNNTAQLESDVYDWVASDRHEISTIKWITDKLQEHMNFAATHGSSVTGSYEGGTHDDGAGGAIPQALKDNAEYVAWYLTRFIEGPVEADTWDLARTRILAINPDFELSKYGGFYNSSKENPWGLGQHERPTLALAEQKLISFGPLAT